MGAVFTWITGMETIKKAGHGYVRLYGCRPESVSAGFSCGLGWTTALSVSHSAAEAAYAALYKWTLPTYLPECYKSGTLAQVRWGVEARRHSRNRNGNGGNKEGKARGIPHPANYWGIYERHELPQRGLGNNPSLGCFDAFLATNKIWLPAGVSLPLAPEKQHNIIHWESVASPLKQEVHWLWSCPLSRIRHQWKLFGTSGYNMKNSWKVELRPTKAQILHFV